MGVGKPSCCSCRQPVEIERNTSRQRTPADAEAIAESIELDLLRQELDTTRTQLHHLQAQHVLATNQSIAAYSRLYEQYKVRSQQNSQLAAEIYESSQRYNAMSKLHRKQNYRLEQEMTNIESQSCSLRQQLEGLHDRSDAERGETLRERLRTMNVNLKEKTRKYEDLQKKQQSELCQERETMKNIAIALEAGNKTLDELSTAMYRHQHRATQRSESMDTPLIPTVSPSVAQQRDIDALNQRIAAIQIKIKQSTKDKDSNNQYLKPIKSHFDYPRDSMEQNKQNDESTKRFSQFYKASRSVSDLAEVHSLIMCRYKTNAASSAIDEEHSEDDDESDIDEEDKEEIERRKREQLEDEEAGTVLVDYGDDYDDGDNGTMTALVYAGEDLKDHQFSHPQTPSSLLKPGSVDLGADELKQMKQEMEQQMLALMTEDIAMNGAAGVAGSKVSITND